MATAGTMNSRSPKAFLLSVLLHGLVVGVVLFFAYSLHQNPPDQPKIFDLVSGVGDNYAATDAPKLGSPTGVNVSFPSVRVVTPTPLPTPVAPPDPEPVQPAPPTPVAPSPVSPVEVVHPRTVPKPAPKPVNFEKLVTRISNHRLANIQKKLDRERKLAEAREAKEAQQQMTKAQFDKLHHQDAPRINVAGIVNGVDGGSASNRTGGAGGKALTREQQALSDSYVALLLQRLAEAHQKPPGLSDLLQATVSFRLNSDGSMSDVVITQSSGNAAFDASVLDAFRRVQLPPPPTNLDTDIYTTTFKMKDDGN